MFEFFTFASRINQLEKGFKAMSQIVEQLKAAIEGLKALVVSEREQVNIKLDTVSAEVVDLKAQIEALSNVEQGESPNFTEVFAAIDTLAADIEGIYVEPEAEIEVPEVTEPVEEVPTETEGLFPEGESGEAFV
jgi:seryl-tRNA synthetase